MKIIEKWIESLSSECLAKILRFISFFANWELLHLSMCFIKKLSVKLFHLLYFYERLKFYLSASKGWMRQFHNFIFIILSKIKRFCILWVKKYVSGVFSFFIDIQVHLVQEPSMRSHGFQKQKRMSGSSKNIGRGP